MARVSFALVPSFSARNLTPYAVVRMSGFTIFTEDAKAAAPQRFRCNRIKSQTVFHRAQPDSGRPHRDTQRSVWGMPAKALPTKREMAQLIAAWEESKIQSETKNRVDAVARAHGEPISHLPADWESIMKGFRQEYGARIPEYYLPSQSYFEACEGQRRQASSRDSRTSGQSGRRGDTGEGQTRVAKAAAPDVGCEPHSPNASQVPLLDAKVYRGAPEKYWVMTHMWLLAKMHQPSRAMYANLDERT